jgi:hypothetical protein
MLTTVRPLIITAVLLLSGCAMASDFQGKTCPFAYGQRVIDKLILPTLKTTYGANYTIWDLNKPGMIEEGNTVQLIFGQWRTDVLDTPDFIIIVDRCTSKVIKAYETSPFPSDAPKQAR